jgi:GTPase SAR1 family protein
MYELQIWIPKSNYYEQKSYETLNYLGNANGVILMYDITNQKTLDALVEYIQLIKKNKIEIPLIIVGNKGDLRVNRDVTIKQANSFVKHYHLSESIEISAKNRETVDLMFERLTKLMLQNFDLNTWKIVKKYIWFDKKGFPHFDGDNVSEEDFDIIYKAYHPSIRCIYCWMKTHCKYNPNIEDCEPHWWTKTEEYRNAKNHKKINYYEKN